jgi:hypothetical protein
LLSFWSNDAALIFYWCHLADLFVPLCCFIGAAFASLFVPSCWFVVPPCSFLSAALVSMFYEWTVGSDIELLIFISV